MCGYHTLGAEPSDNIHMGIWAGTARLCRSRYAVPIGFIDTAHAKF